jgi:GrpB-like predicted nucleotidyltransferase (UPF0157 family)
MQILTYWNQPASLEEWDPITAEAAQRLGEFLMSQMTGVTIEHFGSTAVTGCAGKGVIDLMVLYPPDGLHEARELLDAVGFQKQTSRDPFPEERPMRIGAIEHRGKLFRVHAHVIAADSPEAGELRSFRDRLRAEAELREAYVAKKRAILAEGITDQLEYSNAKGDFIRGR